MTGIDLGEVAEALRVLDSVNAAMKSGDGSVEIVSNTETDRNEGDPNPVFEIVLYHYIMCEGGRRQRFESSSEFLAWAKHRAETWTGD